MKKEYKIVYKKEEIVPGCDIFEKKKRKDYKYSESRLEIKNVKKQIKSIKKKYVNQDVRK